LLATVFELMHGLTKWTIKHICYPHPGQLIGNTRQIAVIYGQTTTACIA
jgi:hypothetical protein